MVSVSSVKSSLTQHDVHLVNYAHIYIKIADKAEYALGRGYLVIDRSLPQRAVMSCSAIWFMDVELKDTPRSRLPVGTFCFKPAFY